MLTEIHNPFASKEALDFIGKLPPDKPKYADPSNRHYSQSEAATVAWLEKNITPISWTGYDCYAKRMYSSGPVYRAAAMLSDGIFIPSVAFANPDFFVWPTRRLKPDMPVTEIDIFAIRYQLFCMNQFRPISIKQVLSSPYALQKNYYDAVRDGGASGRNGELYFVGTMSDGTRWQFYSVCSAPMFVTMPSGYSASDIVAVEPATAFTEPCLHLSEEQDKNFYGVHGYGGEQFDAMSCFWCFSELIKVGDETLIGWAPEK